MRFYGFEEVMSMASILPITEEEEQWAIQQLLLELNKGAESIRTEGGLSIEEAFEGLGV